MELERIMKESSGYRFQRGLTWRSFLSIIFSVFILLPASMYLNLAAGVGISMLVTTIFFTELFALFGSNLTKQETYITFIIAWIASLIPSGGSFYNTMAMGNFLDFVYRAYFVNSIYTQAFIDPATQRPLNYVIPSWWAPSYGSGAYSSRSLLHPEWFFPILLGIMLLLLYIMQEFALTLMSSYLYVEVEKLPFPYAQIDAQTCIILSERPPDQIKIFTFCMLGGIIYGTILYLLPTLSGGAFQIIPIPWIDLTTGFYGIENVLPGALLGIGTDIMLFANGFLLPLHIVTCMLIGSIAIWVFGNWFTRAFFQQVFPEWAGEWVKGMSLGLVYQRSLVRVWLGPQIAFTLAISALLMTREGKSIINSFKRLLRSSTLVREIGYWPLPRILAVYFISSFISILIFYIFVPRFPLWIAILYSLGWGFISGMISSRGTAETGNPISIPYVWQGIVLLSGYKGVEPWFISPVAGGIISPWWTASVKACYLTETKISDFFKSIFLGYALIMVSSFIFSSFFWSIAPIPSSVYPMSLINWPVTAITQSMWITGEISAFKPQVIWASFIGMIIFLSAGEFLRTYTSIPFSAISIVVGTTMLPTSTIPLFIGSAIGWLFLRKVYGEEWWMRYRAIISGGLSVGESLVIAISVALMLIFKGAWILPW